MSSHAMMGRPVDLGYQRIDVIEPIEDVDEIEVVEDNLQEGPWYVQVDAGDVRVISSDQVRDFLRLGVISDRTYVWQQGMPQWMPLSNFLGEPATPSKSAVHVELPTQPYASSRAPEVVRPQPARPAPSTKTAAPARKVSGEHPVAGRKPAPTVSRTASAAPAAAPRPTSSPPSAQASRTAAPPRTKSAPPPSGKPVANSVTSAASLQQLASALPESPAQRGTSAPPPARQVTAAPASVTAQRTTAAPTPVASQPASKAGASTFEVDEDEPWNVLMGPGEVKTISLEQLTDFFRLGVIDEETFVWQKGMSEWTKLATILGPDEEEVPNDIWYVQTSPGEIKTLTLDQLDDFYRLEVIDEHTLVCQPGWAQAYPLGMVAGIDSEPTRLAPAPVQAAPALQSYSKPMTSATQPVKAAPVLQQSYSKPATAPVSIAPQPTATFTSNAPVAMSIIPVPDAPRVRGSWTVRLAIAAGALLVLFRNDVVYSVADAASQKSSYVQTEQKVLGGPIFGTTRAVDSLLAETGGALKPVRLPWIVTEMQGKKNEAAKQSASLAAATPNAVPPSLVPAKPEAPRDTKPAVGESQASAKATNVAAALTGAPVKKFAAVRSAKAAKSTSAPKGAKKKGGQNGPFTGKGAYGDPLAM